MAEKREMLLPDLNSTACDRADITLAEGADVLLEQCCRRSGRHRSFTADDHETLMHRSRTFGDDATPSGNGIAIYVLQRMGSLLGEPRYLRAAERALRAGWASLSRHPSSHCSMLTALDEYLHAPETVILRGESREIERWRRDLDAFYAPRRLVFAIPVDAPDLPSALADKAARGSAVAYVCRGSTCGPPLTSLEALVQSLRFS